MRGGMHESECRLRRAVMSMSSKDQTNSWYMSPSNNSLHRDLSELEMTNRSKHGEVSSSEPQTPTTTASSTPLLKGHASASNFHVGTAPSETYVLPQGNKYIHSPQQVLVDSRIQEMRKSMVYLRETLAERSSTDVETQLIKKHWQDVARIFDRFLFVLYILMIVVSLIVLFPRSSKLD